jgi:hypothetical protein
MPTARNSLFILMSAFALLPLGSLLTHADPLPECPLVSEGETAEDCPWAQVARALVADPSNPDRAAAIQKYLPGLSGNIVADSVLSDVKKLWGRSINFDEYAHGIIIDNGTIDALLKMFDAPLRNDRIVHAGLEHTYGYLFSILKTPFGYKRARWVRDDIEKGLGLPRGLLGPTPPQGSLFQNVSYLIGKIAFQNDPAQLAILNTSLSGAPQQLKDLDYRSLKVTRLEETADVATMDKRSGRKGKRSVTLRTDFVQFKEKVPFSTNTALLVYSVNDTTENGPKLISAFPVEQTFVDRAIDPTGLGDQKPIQARYNIYVDGLSGQPSVTGTRKVWRPNER